MGYPCRECGSYCDPPCDDDFEVSVKKAAPLEKTPEDLFEDALTDPPPLHKVLGEVEQERLKQDQKWGVQNHSPSDWLTILGEEFGEACKAALEAKFQKDYPAQYTGEVGLHLYRKELIQVAAVAIAAIESLDRNELAKAQSDGETIRVPCLECVDGRVGHECGDNCLCADGYMDCWVCDGKGYKE